MDALPSVSIFLLPRMREVDLGCGKALLIKESGEFHAVGHKCPHYGAPLVKGQSASCPGEQPRASQGKGQPPDYVAKHGAVLYCTLSITWASSGWGRHGQQAGVAQNSPEHFTSSGLQLPLLITGLELLLIGGKEDSLWADGILSVAKRMLLMLLTAVG